MNACMNPKATKIYNSNFPTKLRTFKVSIWILIL